MDTGPTAAPEGSIGFASRSAMKRLVFICSLALFCNWFCCTVSEARDTLTLERAINLSLQRNRQLLTTRESHLASQYAVEMEEAVFKLQLRPSASVGYSDDGADGTSRQLGVGLEFSRKMPWGTTVAAAPGVNRLDSNLDGTVEITLTQPLFRGVGQSYNLAGVRAAEYNESNARYELHLARVNTILETVRAVYAIVQAEADVRHSLDSMHRIKTHITGIKAKTRYGYGNAMDLYRAELEVRDAETFLISARQAYADALDGLKILLVLPSDAVFAIQAPLDIDPMELDTENLKDLAMQNRVEILQARDNVREAERRKLLARHNIRPQLDLTLKYYKGLMTTDSIETDSEESEDVSDDAYWTAVLSSNTDFFRRTEQLTLMQSGLHLRAARRNLAVVRDRVINEVKKEVRNLQNALKQVTLNQGSVNQAVGKLALAKIKFRWGRADNFTFIESEKQLRQARIGLVDAMVHYIVSTYQCRAALGTLLENDTL